MTMREFNDDILDDAGDGLGHNGGHNGGDDAHHGPVDAELVALLDRLGASDRSGWSDADSARVASATAGLIGVPERSSVVGSIGPGGVGWTKRGLVRTGRGMGWLAGLAAAAAVGLIFGVGAMLSQPTGPTVPTGVVPGGSLAMGTDESASALDDAALEEELSAWLASRVRLDPEALLSADERDATADAWERDSLDDLETDLASFWAMGSGFAGDEDDGFEVEGTL